MVEALTPIGVLAGIIIAAITAFRSEKANQNAKVQSAQAAKDSAAAVEIIRVEQAKNDYIEILEKEQIIMKSALADGLKRIANLEAAEAVCQEERANLARSNTDLILENNRLRRLTEKTT